MYCTKCGKQIDDSSRYCTACGAPTAVQSEPVQNRNEGNKPTKKEAMTESTQPDKTVTEKKVAESGKKKGFFAELWAEMLDLLKHPKKLIPIFVLSAIWLIMPMITGFIPASNIPIVRFFCTLTYANGGVFGGFFGTVGGIFGKAVFAAVVNGIVLSLFAKKNPFKGIGKGIGGVFTGGLKAISPLLMGGGFGLITYWFFNITSAPQNCAIAVAAAIAAVQAVGKQNGLLFGGVFYLMRKISKEKAPSKIMISRILTGLSAGFTIGFALTFIRYAWVIVLLGIVMLGASIGIIFIDKNGIKKTAATAVLLFMACVTVLPFMTLQTYAKGYDKSVGYWQLSEVYQYDKYMDDYTIPVFFNAVLGNSEDDTKFHRTFTGYKGNYTYQNEIIGEGYCSFSAHGEQKHSCNGELFTVIISSNEPNTMYNAGEEVTIAIEFEAQKEGYFCFEDRLMMYAFINLPKGGSYQNPDEMFESSIQSITLTNEFGETGAEAYTDAETYLCDSQYVTVTNCTVSAEIPAGNKNGDKAYIVVNCSSGSYSGRVLAYEYEWLMDDAPVAGGTSEEDDSNYIPYRGHLTYSNGRVNKHGQPFPDLMDFDHDDDIDYADRQVQYILVHNPDYLETPEGIVLIATVILTGIIGSMLGVGISTVTSAGSSALSSLNVNFDFPEDDEKAQEETEFEKMVQQTDKYISTDGEGDLTVRDPETGVEKHYILNEDGSYRQVENGQNYTKDEIRNDLVYVERNSGYFYDIEGKSAEAVSKQRADNENSELSDFSKEVAEKLKTERERAAYKDRLSDKYGVGADDTEALKRAIKQKELDEYSKQSEIWTDEGNAMEAYEKGAKYVKKGADIAADVVATADKTGIFKDVYSTTTAAAGNAGEVMAGNMTVDQAIIKTTVDASTEIIKNRVKSTGGKFAANIVGDTTQDATGARLDGKNAGEIMNEGLKGAGRGLVDATVDYAVGSGNKMAGDGENGVLTEAGETFISDMIKANLPEVELPKDKE